MSRRVILFVGLGLALVGVGLVTWAAFVRGSAAPPVVTAKFDVASDRMQKTDLIQKLKVPPQVIILGGSRALRFDPAYLQQRSGRSAFNAAVTGARPEDAWALVSLFHARFPAARFRFLWMIHADEFDPKALDPGLVYDATLASFFPRSLITPKLEAEAAHLKIDPMQQHRVFAPDGYVIRDGFERMFPQPGNDAAGVRNNVLAALHTYATLPAKLSPRSALYCQKTLALMDSIAAAPPVIVSAPMDARVLAAITNHGWALRQAQLLRYLAPLQARYKFDFVDLSKAASCGCTAADFFDGIHLRPSGAGKVTAAVLRRFPNAFHSPARSKSPSPVASGV
jgi:hypothetical protein